MMRFSLIEESDEKIGERFFKDEQIQLVESDKADLLLVTEKAVGNKLPVKKIQAKIALLPGDFCSDIYQNIHADCIITYGLSSKNSVTISSIDEDELLVSIQRELLNIADKVIEQQDFPVETIPELDAVQTLAVTAARLLFGFSVNRMVI